MARTSPLTAQKILPTDKMMHLPDRDLVFRRFVVLVILRLCDEFWPDGLDLNRLSFVLF